MVNQRQAPPRRSGGMLAGMDRLTLYSWAGLQGRDLVLEWPIYPALLPAAAWPLSHTRRSARLIRRSEQREMVGP